MSVERAYFFNFIITSCVIVIKSDPDKETNIHRDLRTAIQAVDKAANCITEEVADYLRQKCTSLSPHSLLISFFTSTSGADCVKIYFNGLHLIYEDRLDTYNWFTEEGDLKCYSCKVTLTKGPGLQGLTADLDTKRSRIVVHVKASNLEYRHDEPYPTLVSANLATALQLLESFLYSGLGTLIPSKPVRQVTFTLWKMKHALLQDYPCGKVSLLDAFLEDNKGGPLTHFDWIDKQQVVKCWDCGCTRRFRPEPDELDFVL